MPTTMRLLNPPIEEGLNCTNCGDPIVATAQVFDGVMTIGGLAGDAQLDAMKESY